MNVAVFLEVHSQLKLVQLDTSPTSVEPLLHPKILMEQPAQKSATYLNAEFLRQKVSDQLRLHG